jgi:Family of unknown function (DUF6455)
MLRVKSDMPASAVSRVMDLVADLRPGGRLGRSLSTFSSEDLDRLLASLGKSRPDLFTDFKGNAKHRLRLARMFEHFGVDREHAARSHWNALRDADQVCVRCANVKRCRSWFSWGVNNDAPRIFCPNAELLDELAGQGPAPRAPSAATARRHH